MKNVGTEFVDQNSIANRKSWVNVPKSIRCCRNTTRTRGDELLMIRNVRQLLGKKDPRVAGQQGNAMEESIFNLRLLIEEWKGSLTGCAVKIVNLGIINLWKRIERQENQTSEN